MSKRLASIRRQTNPLSPFERKYLHRRFLKDLLNGHVAPNAGELTRQFDIRLNASCLCVVVVAVQAFDLITQRYPAEQLPVFVENVVNCIAQVLGKYPYGEIVSLNHARYVVLLSFDDESGHCVAKAHDIIDEIEQNLHHYLDIVISFRISRFEEGFDSINALFLETDALTVPESRIVKRAKQYILEHFSDPYLNLKKISEFAGITKSHLSHQYAKETGENLRDFLHKVRIEEAKKLLLSTNMKVYEVCYKVGYKNVESFSRIFKKLTSFSPNKFSRHS
jgi:AraC-like DNA-binding protein